ncbi:MAG: polysaccharide biosynthesis tyrosine autokinase, partial [Lachnospiraceae bacterium]|nr:polysaccharide biosynthesis tyrosine autokinase [Lachnospiraceae bacterium]
EELYNMVETEAIDDTEVFRVTVTSPDAEEAAELANAIAEIAPDKIMEIVSGSSVKVIEYARVATEKSSPSITKYTAVGALLGFVFSCLGVLLLSLVKNGESTEEKIRRNFKDKAVLSVIPQMGREEKKGKKKNKKDEDAAELCEHLSFAAAESYKLLRANISFCFSSQQDCHVIGVTSSVRSEGKSTTSINLAYTLAQTGQRVCLIDCDFHLPSVARSLKIKQKPGMTNFLSGQAGGNTVLQKYSAGGTRLYVITAGDIPPNPSELLSSERMQTVLQMLRDTFDYVVLDLPPIGIVSDALGVSKYIDGMLFVVREDFYDRKLVSSSLRTLDNMDTRLLGMVVTHSTSQQKEYRRYGGKYGSKYGDQYGYGYGYGSVDPGKLKTDNLQPTSSSSRTVEPVKTSQSTAKPETARKAQKGSDGDGEVKESETEVQETEGTQQE